MLRHHEPVDENAACAMSVRMAWALDREIAPAERDFAFARRGPRLVMDITVRTPPLVMHPAHAAPPVGLFAALHGADRLTSSDVDSAGTLIHARPPSQVGPRPRTFQRRGASNYAASAGGCPAGGTLGSALALRRSSAVCIALARAIR